MNGSSAFEDVVALREAREVHLHGLWRILCPSDRSRQDPELVCSYDDLTATTCRRTVRMRCVADVGPVYLVGALHDLDRLPRSWQQAVRRAHEADSAAHAVAWWALDERLLWSLDAAVAQNVLHALGASALQREMLRTDVA